MSAYIIAHYNVDNSERYEDYISGVLPLLQKHGAEILVADYETKNIEGENPHASIVLKFDSEEAAMNWYNDPDYKPVKQIRFDNTSTGSLVLAKQFVPPSK